MIVTPLYKYPELPAYTPWMMKTVSRDEVINSDSPHQCRAGDKVIAGCDCWTYGDDFWQFTKDKELCNFLKEDAAEAFESKPILASHAGVARFTELICEGKKDHDSKKDHDDGDHDWNHEDGDHGDDFHFAGADPMDAIGNMIGGIIGQGLGRIETEMICTSANYMSLAAKNEKFPIPQVPLGPSLDWNAIFGDLGDLGHILGELDGDLPFIGPIDMHLEHLGPMFRSNGNSFNFTFTPAMTDFRKQVLERAFGPDISNHPMGKKMMQPVVPKLMCAISEGTRKCECSNKYDFKDEEFCEIIQSDEAIGAMEMIGYQWRRDPAAYCMKSLVCGELDFETVEAGFPCGFLINGLSFGLFILCAIFKL